MTSDSSDIARTSFLRSSRKQVSSIRFEDFMINSLGAPLNDGLLDEDEDEEINDIEPDQLSPKPEKQDDDEALGCRGRDLIVGPGGMSGTMHAEAL